MNLINYIDKTLDTYVCLLIGNLLDNVLRFIFLILS